MYKTKHSLQENHVNDEDDKKWESKERKQEPERPVVVILLFSLLIAGLLYEQVRQRALLALRG
jgi:hypothetical protein